LGLGVSDIALGTDGIAIVIVLCSCFAGAGTSSSKLEFEGADRARLDVRMLPVLVRDGAWCLYNIVMMLKILQSIAVLQEPG
jgi:hypothetical protein